jgi:hypothetical protein
LKETIMGKTPLAAAWLVGLAIASSAPVAAAAPPPDAGPAKLYLSGTMHIETNRQSWPNPDRL